MPKKERPKEQCSFCSKSKDEVQELNGKLIAGPNDVCICNECVELCCSILAAEGFNKFRLEKDKGSKAVNRIADAIQFERKMLNLGRNMNNE